MWQQSTSGQGRIIPTNGGYHLHLPAIQTGYHNAQLSDYSPIQPRFSLRPPLRLTVRAYASHSGHELRGTAGFGFWNHPFSPDSKRLRLPQAVWFFFASPPNEMALAQGVAGHGWKAATFNAQTASFAALLPLAPLGFVAMRSPALYRRLWPLGQRAIGVSETALNPDLLANAHTYTLDWDKTGALFRVDGEVVHQARHVPRGPLGFVAWLDNQYAIVTPQGRFGFGVMPVPHAQTLVLEQVQLEMG